jgi:DNA polymerase III alpha subunit
MLDAQHLKPTTHSFLETLLKKTYCHHTMIIPAFKSHYSLNKSILTLEKDHASSGPRSILKLIKDHNLENSFLIEDNMSSFLEAYYNSKECGVKLNFGLRLTFCADIDDKSESSIKTESKYIIFLTESGGYEALSKIFSTAASRGFYYLPRMDFKTLKQEWNDQLDIGVPFYDSFLFNNHMKMYNCLPPDFWSCPTFFWEDNSTPFDKIYKSALSKHMDKNYPECELLRTQSIYYEMKDDFLAYLTMRCIGKKSTLQKPNLDHMCSDEFCMESYLEKIEE